MLRYCKHTALHGAKQVGREPQPRAIRSSLAGLWLRAEPIIMESHVQASIHRLAYCYPLLHTIEEGIKRLADVFAL